MVLERSHHQCISYGAGAKIAKKNTTYYIPNAPPTIFKAITVKFLHNIPEYTAQLNLKKN